MDKDNGISSKIIAGLVVMYLVYVCWWGILILLVAGGIAYKRKEVFAFLKECLTLFGALSKKQKIGIAFLASVVVVSCIVHSGYGPQYGERSLRNAEVTLKNTSTCEEYLSHGAESKAQLNLTLLAEWKEANPSLGADFPEMSSSCYYHKQSTVRAVAFKEMSESAVPLKEYEARQAIKTAKEEAKRRRDSWKKWNGKSVKEQNNWADGLEKQWEGKR